MELGVGCGSSGLAEQVGGYGDVIGSYGTRLGARARRCWGFIADGVRLGEGKNELGHHAAGRLAVMLVVFGSLELSPFGLTWA